MACRSPPTDRGMFLGEVFSWLTSPSLRMRGKSCESKRFRNKFGMTRGGRGLCSQTVKTSVNCRPEFISGSLKKKNFWVDVDVVALSTRQKKRGKKFCGRQQKPPQKTEGEKSF